ncbi:ATP-binding cassette domain-containing protein [bacterium]|nr:ATP-binding cassette domain-containing protein [bacterium]
MSGGLLAAMRVFARFTPYLLRYWPHLAATLLSTGLFVLFTAAAYWLAGSFLHVLFTGDIASQINQTDPSLNDRLKAVTSHLLVTDTRLMTLFYTAVAIVAAFLGKNLFGYLQLYFISFIEQRVIKDLRDQMFSHLLKQDLGFFHERRRGDVMSTLLNDVQQLNQALNKSFTKIVRDPISLVVLLILLFAVSTKLTIAALFAIPLFGWVIPVLGAKIRSHAASMQEAVAGITSQLQETFSGIRVVKAFSAEAFESERFQARTHAYYRSAVRRESLRRLTIPSTELVGILIFSGILYVGGELVLVRGTIPSGDFVRFLVLLFGLLSPVGSMTNLYANIRVAEAAGERVFRVLDTPPRMLPAPGAPVPGTFRQSIRFDNVSFRYQPDEPHVLSNIAMTIQQGERLAVVGKSGSGKSTLLNLLPRFYDPVEGSIRLDDTDLRSYDLHALRRLFGVVTQQVVLFHTTVRENIAYGMDDVGEEEIIHAAREAHADDFIRSLPEGYDTIVGEEGALLSGGQRQRISIARALLRNPSIVILDEATSALDPESEEAVNAALARLAEGRTVVTVTHRLAAVRQSERILVIDEGRLIAEGSHDQLLRENRVYRDLARQQKLLSTDEDQT